MAQPSFLLVTSFYPEFLNDLYREHPGLADTEYDTQLGRLLDSGFSAVDAYRDGLLRLGCEVNVVIVNADRLQARWAREHGLVVSEENVHDRRRIVDAQIEHFRPDVLYVFEWCPLGDAFLAGVKNAVRLLVGQVASPLKPDRTYASYDLMISSLPNLVDHFRRRGLPSERLRLGFDARVLERIAPRAPRYDVTFIGGFAPSHRARIAWLERLLAEVPIDVFGYGVDTITPDSPIRAHYRGPVWGWTMYEVLQRSRITLNMHAQIEVGSPLDGRFANNMRLFEATGMGTCLVTDAKENLGELFEVGREVVAYANAEKCIDTVKGLLADPWRREEIARAGQARTLSQHTYGAHMAELLEILGPHLAHAARPRSSCTAGPADTVKSRRR